MNPKADALRAQILEQVRRYHAEAFPERPFVPGKTPVPYAGRVFDAEELVSLVDASLDFWLTTGRFAERFEKEFAEFAGVRHALLTNSGSSANLLAVSALTSPKLGERRLVPGDEVITVAAGFPTTVNPILQNGLVPVFVDVTIPTYNVDVTQLEAALSDRTRAVILAHTLGNPFDLDAVTAFAKAHGLWLIEDCCDALGSTYGGRKVGTFGDLATVSFYPAHHMTMGEGGCVLTSDPRLKLAVESFRDWGRDCWCAPGKDNTCGKRFGCKLGELPEGYDHKYTYSHIGYNLKATDMQAAVGVAQLPKLPGFIEARKRNFHALYRRTQRPGAPLHPARSHGEERPELVRLPPRGARGGALQPGPGLAAPGSAQDRHAPPLRRQPHPPTGLPPCSQARRRRVDQLRLRHEPGLLARRLPGTHRRHARPYDRGAARPGPRYSRVIP